MESNRVSCKGYSGSLAGLVRHCRRVYGRRAGVHFVLQARPDIPYGRVVVVLDALRKAGFNHLRLQVVK